MNPIFRHASMVFLGVVVFSCERAAGGILGELKPGQHLEVWFGSTGCFHKDKYFFDFRGNRVSVSRVTEDAEGNLIKHVMGAVELSGEEIEAIDRMFVRYRNAPDSGSTSSEALSVEIWESRRRVSKEVLVDGCPSYIGRAEGEFRLWDLIERVQGTETSKDAE